LRERRGGGAEERARAAIASNPDACSLTVAEVRTWRPSGVDVIITDPPYVTDDSLDLYAALADFALDVLPTGAALVTMTDDELLPDVLSVMRRERLKYRGVVCWRYESVPLGRDFDRNRFLHWKPVVVHHRDGWAGAKWTTTIVNSKRPDRSLHAWQQDTEGFRQLVLRFSEPGQVVCDPFAGSGTTGVAALMEHRKYLGADVDAEAIEQFRERLTRPTA